MGDFLLCIAQYLLIMVVLAAIGGLGGFIGVRLRRKKDAKTAAQTQAASNLPTQRQKHIWWRPV